MACSCPPVASSIKKLSIPSIWIQTAKFYSTRTAAVLKTGSSYALRVRDIQNIPSIVSKWSGNVRQYSVIPDKSKVSPRVDPEGEQEQETSSSSSSSSSELEEEDDNEDQAKEYPSPNDEEYGEYTSNRGDFENENMVQLSPLQRAIITVGSGLAAFLNPTKAENIATFGEISAGPVLRRLYHNMMEDPEGYRILSQKPRINSKTIDLDYLSTLPEGTLGHAYTQFLQRNNVTPDSRLPVRFIEDPELAYVMQRYREVHDLVHTVTGQPTNMLGEVVVKWIEGIQTGLPMCVTGGLFGATRLYPKQRQLYINSHLKWAIEVGFTSRPFLYIFYEERWEESLDNLRFHICPKLLSPPKSSVKKNKKEL